MVSNATLEMYSIERDADDYDDDDDIDDDGDKDDDCDNCPAVIMIIIPTHLWHLKLDDNHVHILSITSNWQSS